MIKPLQAYDQYGAKTGENGVVLEIRHDVPGQPFVELERIAEWYDGLGPLERGVPDGKDERIVYQFTGAVSGYVVLGFLGGELTVAFSNPILGTNKLAVGTGRKADWDRMDDHDYEEFREYFEIDGRKLMAVCKCNGGPANYGLVKIFPDDRPPAA